MKKATITTSLLAVMLAATPAFGSACRVETIDREAGSPRLDNTITPQEHINLDIVGQFLWVQLGDEGTVISAEIPADADSVTVCDDGTVTFTNSAPRPEAPEPTNLVDFWRGQGYNVVIRF